MTEKWEDLRNNPPEYVVLTPYTDQLWEEGDKMKCVIMKVFSLLPNPDDEGNYAWIASCNAVHDIRKILVGAEQ